MAKKLEIWVKDHKLPKHADCAALAANYVTAYLRSLGREIHSGTVIRSIEQKADRFIYTGE